MQYLTEIFQLRIEIQRYINEHVFLPQVVTAISSSPVLPEDFVCVTPNKPITLWPPTRHIIVVPNVLNKAITR